MKRHGLRVARKLLTNPEDDEKQTMRQRDLPVLRGLRTNPKDAKKPIKRHKRLRGLPTLNEAEKHIEMPRPVPTESLQLAVYRLSGYHEEPAVADYKHNFRYIVAEPGQVLGPLGAHLRFSEASSIGLEQGRK